MQTPPFLISAALLFWGWQTELLPFAVIIAVILEGSRLLKLRWDFSLSEFIRIADLSSLFIVGILVYLVLTQDFYNILFIFLQWLPVAFFPLLTAQCYSTGGVVDVRALLLTVRKRKQTSSQKPILIDLSHAYVICCIIAAGAANTRQTNLFYAAVVALAAWALWSVRSQRYSPVVWGSLIVIASIIGYFGHVQLNQFQRKIEQSEFLGRLFGMIPENPDPYQSITAIGDIGTVKLSNQVVFRVKSETGYPAPLLLREASYNTYKSSRWHAARYKFTDIQAETGGTTWKIQLPLATSPPAHLLQGEGRQTPPSLAGKGAGGLGQRGKALKSATLVPLEEGMMERITVSSYLTDGAGMLKLPTGTVQIEDLPVLILKTNQFGAVKVEEGPKIVTYQSLFSQPGALDSPPEENDHLVPPDELPALTKLVQELQLTSLLSPDQVLPIISAFFQQNFSYSLDLERQAENTTPLADFLFNFRSGHCEYFATATVLLLRAAGIPARYAAGYSIDGLEQAGKWTLVRGRHAHAWTLVYFNGTWHDFDTTPPTWYAIENAEASSLEWLSDLWAQWRFALTEWRQRQSGDELSPYFLLLLIPLFFILGRKIYSKKRRKRLTEDMPQEARVLYPGIDSEFYLIEEKLQELGFFRQPWETLTQWVQRIEKLSSASTLQSLHPLLTLHYRYRFDPEGITPAEKEALKAHVQSWLEQHEAEHSEC